MKKSELKNRLDRQGEKIIALTKRVAELEKNKNDLHGTCSSIQNLAEQRHNLLVRKIDELTETVRENEKETDTLKEDVLRIRENPVKNKRTTYPAGTNFLQLSESSKKKFRDARNFYDWSRFAYKCS